MQSVAIRIFILCTAVLFVFVQCQNRGASSTEQSQPSEEKTVLECAEKIYAAQQSKKASPQASGCLADLDLKKAYQVQTALVNKLITEKTIYGFKAGLTTKAAQQNFNVDQAVAGVLFREGKRSPGDTLFFADYNRLMVETELGFFLNREISSPIESLEELKTYVQSVLPVLEFPNAAFGDNPGALDIISANVGSAYYILGPKSTPDGLDLNELEVTLQQGDNLMNQGKGADALGDQWETLRWLINTMVGQGYVIHPDHLLITGALGKAFPGVAGAYAADYSPLGNIVFHIR